MPTITHNATVDTKKGDKLFLFVEVNGVQTPIALATSCGMDLSADTIEATSKMSGDWKEYLAGQIGYTISCDSLVSYKVGHASFQTLKKMMAAKTPISFVIGLSKSDSASDFSSDTAGVYETGTAIITSLSWKADKGALCSSSISLQGTGELADGNIGDKTPDLVVTPTTLDFTAAADATGQTITAASIGNITSAKKDDNADWLTVTRSLKIATVKVVANTNSESRTANVTIVADGKTAIVTVTQAGA